MGLLRGVGGDFLREKLAERIQQSKHSILIWENTKMSYSQFTFKTVKKQIVIELSTRQNQIDRRLVIFLRVAFFLWYIQLSLWVIENESPKKLRRFLVKRQSCKVSDGVQDLSWKSQTKVCALLGPQLFKCRFLYGIFHSYYS